MAQDKKSIEFRAGEYDGLEDETFDVVGRACDIDSGMSKMTVYVRHSESLYVTKKADGSILANAVTGSGADCNVPSTYKIVIQEDSSNAAYLGVEKVLLDFAAGTSWATSTNSSPAISVSLGVVPAPGAPTVSVVGAMGGATTYTYRVVAKYGSATSAPGTAASSTTSQASLTVSNYNHLSWTNVAAATSYDIYRTVGGATQGKIGTSVTTTFDDTGLTASGTLPSVAIGGSTLKIRGSGGADTIVCGTKIDGTQSLCLFTGLSGGQVDIKMSMDTTHNPANLVISGGEGADTISGNGGNAQGGLQLDPTIAFSAYGGGGADTLTGGRSSAAVGGNLLSGGAGDDTFNEVLGYTAPDNIQGGTGKDTVDYNTRTAPLTVSICSTPVNTCTALTASCAATYATDMTAASTADTTCTAAATTAYNTCIGNTASNCGAVKMAADTLCNTAEATCSGLGAGCMGVYNTCTGAGAGCQGVYDTCTGSGAGCQGVYDTCTGSGAGCTGVYDTCVATADATCIAGCTGSPLSYGTGPHDDLADCLVDECGASGLHSGIDDTNWVADFAACGSAQTMCVSDCADDQTTCVSGCAGTQTTCVSGCAATQSTCDAACDATQTACLAVQTSPYNTCVAACAFTRATSNVTCTNTYYDALDTASDSQDSCVGMCVNNGTCVGDDGESGEGDTVNTDVEVVKGGSGADTLTASGAPCDQTATPAKYQCELYGNGGNDVLQGSSFGDILNGGTGVNTVDYSDRKSDTPVYATLDTAAAPNGYWVTGQNGQSGENDTLVTIQNIKGGRGADKLRGDANGNTIWGGTGADIIEGGGGIDSLYGENGADQVYGGAGNDQVSGGAGRDTLVGGDGEDLIDALDSHPRGDTVNCDWRNLVGGAAITSAGSADVLFGDSNDTNPIQSGQTVVDCEP